ncbi:MAG: hypothetical protein AAGM33_08455 [Pseudomonadota bacterium]
MIRIFAGLFAALMLVVQPAAAMAADDKAIPEYPVPKNAAKGQFVAHDQFKAAPFTAGEVTRFMFDGWAGKPFPVWTFVPSGVDVTKAPIMFMMHGAKRNPARYLLEWVPHAQKYGFVVIAPEFAARDFSGSRRYNLGFVFGRRGDDYYLRDEEKWTFSAIEPLFDHAVSELGSVQTAYTLFGHSAGSQFVHRFLYYKPDARVKRFLAANAGWYTMPDAEQVYPYGFKDPYGLADAALGEDRIRMAVQKDMIILLGDQDNDANHESLRRTPEAMLQGEHRFNRGAAFLDAGHAQAKRLGVECGWRGAVVKGVAHSNGGIAKVAAKYVK